MKRAHKKFNFRNGSIGNYFLTGARIFFGSLESAIFLFSAITGIAEPTKVVPVINTNHGISIAAELQNGKIILGQCEISHPSQSTIFTNSITPSIESPFGTPPLVPSDDDSNISEIATSEKYNRNILPLLDAESFSPISTLLTATSNIIFDKSSDSYPPMASRISRIYYINEYGQEIFPSPNPKIIRSLHEKSTLIYSIGSLYTSILPCLILRGVGKAIAESSTLSFKILILNGSPDRETLGYTALDFIKAVVDGCNHSLKLSGFWPNEYEANKYITHLIYLEQSAVPVNTWEVEKLGIECISIKGVLKNDREPIYTDEGLDEVLRKIITE